MSSPLRPVNRSTPAMTSGGTRMSATAKVEIIQPADYSDRRSEPRAACDDRGALLFMSSQTVVQCRILDQSPSGARVAFENSAPIPAELWLIDLDTNMVRRGSSAWSTPTRMGLKFNFVQTLRRGQPCPAKVPQPVFDAWLKLSGQMPAETARDDARDDTSDDDNIFFLD
jgi:hypothetical protein